jgi:hypothetical protein
MKLPLFLRVGEMLPPPGAVVRRDDTSGLHLAQMPIEQTMRKRIIQVHGMGHARDVCQPHCLEHTGEAAPHPPVTHAVAERLEEGTRRLLVGAVDKHHAPIHVKDDDLAPGADHARHLRHGACGVVHMHQDALGATPVEGGVRKLQLLRVPYHERHRQSYRRMAALRFGDHDGTRVDADTPPPWADRVGEDTHIIACPTPDVEHMYTVMQL